MFQKPAKCFININSFNSYKNIEAETLCAIVSDSLRPHGL